MHVSIIDFPNLDDKFAFVSFERHLTYGDIASTLYSSYFSEIGSCSTLIIRPPVDIQIENLIDIRDEISKIIERFPLTSFFIIYSNDFKIILSENLNSNASNKIEWLKKKDEVITYLRQKELEGFILTSSALIKCPTPKTLFRTPSQEYSHVFLRVGSIQTNRNVLDSIFFWILPELKDAGALLTDSWSISSIALNISRLLIRYVSKDESKAKEIAKNFHVNMLSGFYHGLREMDKDTTESLSPLLYNNKKKIVFIISAIKTNKSLGNIKKEIIEKGLAEKVEYIALYRLVNTVNERHLCDLSGDFETRNQISFDSKLAPNQDELVVPIDEQSFYPLEVRDSLIEIKKAGADISKDFFENYGGKDVISLHRKSFYLNNTPHRHHGIFINVSNILKSEVFIEKLKSKIQAIEQLPACIIYPPHEQGKEFVEIISEMFQQKFNQKPKLYCFSELEIEPEIKRKEVTEFLQSLDDTALLFIVDDVSTTGDRLHTYQRQLYTISYKGKVIYFVGVARPESDEAWDRRKRILQVNKHSILDFVEKVILPDWDSITCPWCQEKKMLELQVEKGEYKALSMTQKLETRINELIQSERFGLINNVYFDFGNDRKAQFMGGSIFCNKVEISEADLTASIASTIQHLRNGYLTKEVFYKLTPGHPLYSIIHPHDYLKGNEKLFEPLIKAALIRCAYHRELYATQDTNRQDQKKMILDFLRGSHLRDSDKTFFIYELYLSMKLGKLPKPAIQENLRNILESYFTTGVALKNA